MDLLGWWLRLCAWLLCLACLSPAVLRLFLTLRRPCRYLDPIWGVVFLLALNRVAYMTHVSPPLSDATALALALVMGALSVRYQLNDR